MNKIEETAMLFDWFSDRGQPFQVQGIDVDNGVHMKRHLEN